MIKRPVYNSLPLSGSHCRGSLCGHMSWNSSHRSHGSQDGHVCRGGGRGHGLCHWQDVCRTWVSRFWRSFLVYYKVNPTLHGVWSLWPWWSSWPLLPTLKPHSSNRKVWFGPIFLITWVPTTAKAQKMLQNFQQCLSYASCEQWLKTGHVK